MLVSSFQIGNADYVIIALELAVGAMRRVKNPRFYSLNESSEYSISHWHQRKTDGILLTSVFRTL